MTARLRRHFRVRQSGDIAPELFSDCPIRIGRSAESQRVDRVPEIKLDRMQPEASASRPCLKRAPDPDRYDRDAQLIAQDGGSFFEFREPSIDRAGTFWKDQKHA